MYRFIGPYRPITLTTCVTCATHIIPNDIVESVHEEDRDADIQNRTINFFWETEPKFKQDLENIYTTRKNEKKTKLNIRKTSRSLVTEFK